MPGATNNEAVVGTNVERSAAMALVHHVKNSAIGAYSVGTTSVQAYVMLEVAFPALKCWSCPANVDLRK